MLKLYFFILVFFKFINIFAEFTPNITYVKTINEDLSLPYYLKFNKEPDKFGNYTLWVSNNPFGSKQACNGYISKFNFNSKSFNLNFLKKIHIKDILGIATYKKNCFYAGEKSYPAITENGQNIIQAINDPQYLILNSKFCNCSKKENINYYALLGPIKNIKLSPFKFKSKGVEYQLLATASSFIANYYTVAANNNQLLIFTYALNGDNKSSNLSSPIIILDNINFPLDIEFSSFSSSDGTYLLSVANANGASLSLFKVNISNPDSISIDFYESIDVIPNLGNYQQYYSAFSNKRYFALNRLDVGKNNIYVYYFDENFKYIILNNGKAYDAGSLSQVIDWSPDSKALIAPNYLDNSLTLFKANVKDFKVELTPDYILKYLLESVTLTAKVTGGIPPYTFYFSDGTVKTQESDTCSITVSPAITTIYNVTVVDSENNITGIANPVTVQIAKPVITKISSNCQKNILYIKGKILSPSGFPVINSTIHLFLGNKKIYVTSNKKGVFKLEYNLYNYNNI